MRTHNTTPGKSLHSEYAKDNKYTSQLQKLESHYLRNTTSRYMASVATGIPLQNVCRYVDMLFKSESIQVIRKDKCLISGEWVEFLSCDAKLFVKSTQLNLFEITIPKPEIKVKYELFERYTEEGAHYEVNQSNGPTKLLKIQPFQWSGHRNLCWPMIFEGNLEDCDKLVANLINTGKP